VEVLPEPSEREQTKWAQLKGIHARMTENMDRSGVIFTTARHTILPKIGDTFSLMVSLSRE
jgi:hypothetical protein